jgi:hypothetical protein
MIRRLATKGDEFLSAGSHAPLVVELDTAGEIPLAMSLADVAPQDRLDLLRRGSCCRGEWVFSRMEPSRGCPRDTAALAGVMRALISSILTANQLLGLRHPLQSSGLDDSTGRLVSRSRERSTRVRPAMRSSVTVATCDSSSSEVRTIGCCRRHVKTDPQSAGWFPSTVATLPRFWGLCCRRLVV